VVQSEISSRGSGSRFITLKLVFLNTLLYSVISSTVRPVSLCIYVENKPTSPNVSTAVYTHTNFEYLIQN
jgi:hypothetical protein